MSTYACFLNNPILLNDPKGDTPGDGDKGKKDDKPYSGPATAIVAKGTDGFRTSTAVGTSQLGFFALFTALSDKVVEGLWKSEEFLNPHENQSNGHQDNTTHHGIKFVDNSNKPSNNTFQNGYPDSHWDTKYLSARLAGKTSPNPEETDWYHLAKAGSEVKDALKEEERPEKKTKPKPPDFEDKVHHFVNDHGDSVNFSKNMDTMKVNHKGGSNTYLTGTMKEIKSK